MEIFVNQGEDKKDILSFKFKLTSYCNFPHANRIIMIKMKDHDELK